MSNKNITYMTPYTAYGKEYHSGWDHLVDPIISEIIKYNTNNPDNCEIFQIKEKFGTLRIYLNNAPEYIIKMAKEAENKSATICELCGNEGTLRSHNGWLVTRCNNCEEKYYERK